MHIIGAVHRLASSLHATAVPGCLSGLAGLVVLIGLTGLIGLNSRTSLTSRPALD